MARTVAESMDKELGRITKVDLFIEDHGTLTLSLHFDFGGAGQGFGGYSLDAEGSTRREGTAGGLDFILRLLQLFKVERLEQIRGRVAYALRASRSLSEPIIGIEIPPFDGGGRFLVEDWREEWMGASGREVAT